MNPPTTHEKSGPPSALDEVLVAVVKIGDGSSQRRAIARLAYTLVLRELRWPRTAPVAFRSRSTPTTREAAPSQTPPPKGGAR